MKEYPPVILVDTWLYLIQNKTPELEYMQFSLHRVIKSYFGTIELAQLYVEQLHQNDVDLYFV
jgi:hypothetical protein